MHVTKIVITGGPCGGKSSALVRVKEHFEARGYTVLTISEVATELIEGGIAPWTCGSYADFQRVKILLQEKKEQLYVEAAQTMSADRVLIVCDRGSLDSLAYASKTLWLDTIGQYGLTEEDVIHGYGAVFHLVTAAKGAESSYTTANNTARRETPEEAARLDDLTLDAWAGHPYRRVIDNSTDFEGKLARLCLEIERFLEQREQTRFSE